MYLENDVRLAPRRTKPRVSSNAKKGPIPVWSELLDSLDLPDFNQLMEETCEMFAAYKRVAEPSIRLQSSTHLSMFV